MSKSKRKGTAWESAIVAFLRERLGDDRIERRALHGANDLGDIYGLFAHGFEGIIEAKDYRSWGPADLAEWKAQTVAERGNADADFALLVVHARGCGQKRFGQNHCYLQIKDLEKVAGGTFTCVFGDAMKDVWVRVSLEDACRLIEGILEGE